MAKQQKKMPSGKASTKVQEQKIPPKAASLLGPEYDTRVLWFLAIMTLLVYARAIFGEFTNWDDQVYVVNNKLIAGLNWTKLKDIFSQGQVGNYHPFTMLSYAIENSLFGLNPKVFHITTILIHTATTLLVYRLSRILKFGVEVSLIVAVIFALHPMHVESVAWISERKDVLYAFFYVASLICYVMHAGSAEKIHWRYYAFSIGFFVCALLSKGQAVSLSVVLLVVDYYLARGWSKQVLLEKIPFFALSLLFGIVAIKVQQSFGYMGAVNIYSLGDRMYFAAYGLVLYIVKFLFPFKLSSFVPFPAQKDFLIYVSPIILLLLAFLIYKSFKTNKVFFFGSLFFVGSIMLVLQLLPVGGALIAERYSYIPYIGLSFIVGNWVEQLLLKYYRKKDMIYAFFTIVMLAMAFSTFTRIGMWHDNLVLWTDAVSKYPSAVGYNNRGSAYKILKKPQEAIADFTAALKFAPTFYEVLVARGEELRGVGRVEEAYQDLDKAIHQKPNADWSAYMNRAVVFCMKGQLDKAKMDFDSAIKKAEPTPELYANYGNYWDMKDSFPKAMECYNKAIALDKKFENAYIGRATANCRKKNYDTALKDFDLALKLKPKFIEVYTNRSFVYNDLKRYPEALQDALKAKELGAYVDPNYIEQLKQKVNNSK